MIELIRIKVIEGSHLVLIVVAVLLAIALALAGFSYLAKEQPREATTTTQNVEAAAAFCPPATRAPDSIEDIGGDLHLTVGGER
ncbi:MAG: hypothetical protein RR150_12320, partial [Clostridia bacterium]